ncbi:hypothetical protein [Dysosmobacter welbionis]|uniref:hypothetical protein n=1 Tax=Dysosmobacter welbionis TaxID=2093857 RepID=UPI0029420BBB|nr:hypothetical protein [Dysosmobacter welbionis]
MLVSISQPLFFRVAAPPLEGLEDAEGAEDAGFLEEEEEEAGFLEEEGTWLSAFWEALLFSFFSVFSVFSVFPVFSFFTEEEVLLLSLLWFFVSSFFCVFSVFSVLAAAFISSSAFSAAFMERSTAATDTTGSAALYAPAIASVSIAWAKVLAVPEKARTAATARAVVRIHLFFPFMPFFFIMCNASKFSNIF